MITFTAARNTYRFINHETIARVAQNRPSEVEMATSKRDREMIRTKNSSTRILSIAGSCALACAALSTQIIAATSETVLYSFHGYDDGDADGIGPGGAVLASDGNLYGTTGNGGQNDANVCGTTTGDGTVFKVTPTGQETILYSFGCGASGNTIGAFPTTGLIQGPDGDFYGTTPGGAAYGVGGHPGSIFKITTGGTETPLFPFTGSPNGANPNTWLVEGSDGNFYGTTTAGGASGVGTVFKVTPGGSETVLHSFTGGVDGSTDGAAPYGGLIQATDGNFYGTTSSGGKNGVGTVFKITSTGAEKVIYSFAGGVDGSKDGASPRAPLVQGTNGNLFGTTFSGGAQTTNAGTGSGTIFEVTTDGVETLLHSFGSTSTDGTYPFSPLIVGSDGNLYGTTFFGGQYPGEFKEGGGTVFRVTNAGVETVLYSFGGTSTDGGEPGGLIAGPNNIFYGTTLVGGTYGYGSIFKLTGVVSGTGVPSVKVSAGSLAFGNQATGGTSAAKTVTLTNGGTATLTFSSITLTGAQSDDFSLTKTCGSTLEAGSSCTISLVFKPVSTGSKTATVSIGDNASGSPQTVSLTGTGTAAGGSPSATVNPTSLAFGNQAEGGTSSAKTVTVTNTGGASLSLTSITLTGGQADDFVLSYGCGASLAAGSLCTLSITFKPVSTGSKVAAVSIVDNAGGSPQSVALSGTGTSAGSAPAVKLSATSLSFSSQPVGSTSAAKMVTLTNTGKAALDLTSITLTGGQADDFALTKTCGSTLAVSASCTLSVTFKPVSTGAKAASISLADNAAGAPQSVSLTGTGTAASNSPGSRPASETE